MIPVFLYFATLLGWVIYSYSQIDLNLTLFQSPIFLNFQKLMIQLGYYNRPLSSLFFIALLILLYKFYVIYSTQTSNNKITRQKVILLIAGTAGILFLAYPAFSHDIFNYMFDARIVTYYHQNPWLFKALDFPSDSWLRFMHWTHRYYPYGPAWLAVTLVPSFLGIGKFVITLLNFKILFSLAYLICSWLIYRIVMKVHPDKALPALALYAFNPLIIIETLISPHNESFMLMFLLMAIYLWVTNNKLLSIVSLLLSGGVKFLTLLLIPIDIYSAIAGKISISKEEYFRKVVGLSTVILVIGLIPVILLREPYPWYLVTIIGLAALLLENKKLQLLLGAISLGTLLRYLPFIYTGDYSVEMQIARNILTIAPLFILFLLYILFRLKKISVLRRYPF